MARLKAEVKHLLDIGAWHKLLSIEVPAYCNLKLELLTSFECPIGYNVWDVSLTIHFQLRRQVYHLSPLLMGIYTTEYTVTEEYRNLISSPPL